MTQAEAKYYVLSTETSDPSWPAFVLNAEGPDTLAQARSRIAWQGHSVYSRWHIAERTGPDTFQTREGLELRAYRSCYTEAFWAEFKAGWKEIQLPA